jgi:hypothetical protein
LQHAELLTNPIRLIGVRLIQPNPMIIGTDHRNAVETRWWIASLKFFPGIRRKGCLDIPRQFSGDSETSRDLL